MHEKYTKQALVQSGEKTVGIIRRSYLLHALGLKRDKTSETQPGAAAIKSYFLDKIASESRAPEYSILVKVEDSFNNLEGVLLSAVTVIAENFSVSKNVNDHLMFVDSGHAWPSLHHENLRVLICCP